MIYSMYSKVSVWNFVENSISNTRAKEIKKKNKNIFKTLEKQLKLYYDIYNFNDLILPIKQNILNN